MSLNSHFDEELDVLRAIYLDDLVVFVEDSINATLQVSLNPNTGADSESQFVCLTLCCIVPVEYPEKQPQFTVKNPRGLSEVHITSIEENLSALASQKVGEMMLFDLVEYAKESLTDNNHPSCNCSICLDHFAEGGKFFRSECYHYFHYQCIKAYVQSVLDKHACPVCRSEIPDKEIQKILLSVVNLNTSDEQIKENNDYMHSKKYKKWLAECKSLFDKQKEQGGIIDIEYERNKYLITSTTSIVSPSTSSTEQSKENATNSQQNQPSTNFDRERPARHKSHHHKKTLRGNKSGETCPNRTSSKHNRRKGDKPLSHHDKEGVIRKKEHTQKNESEPTNNNNQNKVDESECSPEAAGPSDHSKKKKTRKKHPQHPGSGTERFVGEQTTINNEEHITKEHSNSNSHKNTKQPPRPPSKKQPPSSSNSSKEAIEKQQHQHGARSSGKQQQAPIEKETIKPSVPPDRRYRRRERDNPSRTSQNLPSVGEQKDKVRPPPGFPAKQEIKKVRPPPGFSRPDKGAEGSS